MFSPMRRRVRHGSTADSTGPGMTPKVAKQFSARLRGEMDLEGLTTDLGVVTVPRRLRRRGADGPAMNPIVPPGAWGHTAPGDDVSWCLSERKLDEKGSPGRLADKHRLLVGSRCPRRFAPSAGASPVLETVELFAFVILGTFGYLIVRRQPTNAVAWLAIIPGLVFPLEAALSDVAHFALTSWGPDHWVTAVAGWCALWVWIPGPYSIPFLLALYPNGQPASPRWRPLLWLLWTLVALSFFISAFAPGPVDEVLLPGLNNPLGIAAFIPSQKRSHRSSSTPSQSSR